MKYGYFNDDNKEYIITNPKTPVKWINYIGDLSFGGFLDQTGGSLICKGDPATNRITKYIPQLPDSDFKGETAYIRIKEKEKYKIFSPFYTPTLDDYDFYECRVGMGYSKYVSSFYGINCEITVFVPLNDHREIRDIKITNTRSESIEIDFIPLVEYTHFDALKNFTNADWVPQTMMSDILDSQDEFPILLQYAFMRKNEKMNFFTSNFPISSYESHRENFLGNNGYGTFKSPQALLEKELSNSLVKRGNNIGVLMHHMGKLEPGQSQRIITQLGQMDDIEEEKVKIVYYRNEKNVDKAFKELNIHWDKLLENFHVKTPNKAFDSMINIFNPRQCDTTLNWSRYLSLYQLGLGARGIGFRDSAQDVMGVLGHSPEQAKDLLIKLLSVQKMDGSAMHQFNPKTMIANEGDSREEEDCDNFYGDDHLWLILAIGAYLKETGDMDFLNQEISFYDKDRYNQPLEKDSVLNHMRRALSFTKTHTGKHGLPLLGFADWNDTVNLKPGAESVFIANLYGLALMEMIDLFDYLKQNNEVKYYHHEYQNMKEIVNKYAWDGDWYLRYFDASGKTYGSHKNEYGKIYANAQSWTVMSGFANQTRAKESLASLNQYLNTEKGIKLSFPGYNAYDSQVGGVTSYPPGAKENGGIFLHSNPWVMIAETICGNGSRAFQYYNQINPATKNDCIDEFECEPYVYPQNILGDEHPQFGLARNSWLSGTASWTYQAATKYILGVKPTYHGLLINPCIPKEWDHLIIRKKYRGCTYHIEVFNPNHKEKTSVSLKIDDKSIEGNIIPIDKDKNDCKVIVEMK